MQTARQSLFDRLGSGAGAVTAVHAPPGAPRRSVAEGFIREVFAQRYGARVRSFAPNLVFFEEAGQVVAATGWRAAGHETLFLERYLDRPVEEALGHLASQAVSRQRIVEVGNLASTRSGGSVHVILALARQLDQLGFEWVVFTATAELVRLFSRLGLPLFALAPADPSRLGDAAADWGTYYDAAPVVVAGRVRQGVEVSGRWR
jgi:hypothetical protein